MSSLYEISRTYLEFLEAVEDGEIPSEAIRDTLDGIECEFRQKADNIACLIKSLLADAASIKNEVTALMDRKAAKEQNAERLRRYLSETMQRLEIHKLETPRNAISFRKSASVQIDDESDFKQRHPEYCKTQVEVKISKAEIGKALKSGEEISGAHLLENQNIQIK